MSRVTFIINKLKTPELPQTLLLVILLNLFFFSFLLSADAASGVINRITYIFALVPISLIQF